MSETPFVSIIITTFNGRAVLEDCIKSIKAQDYPADRREVILIDDSSGDGTYGYVALPVLMNSWLKDKAVHYDWDDREERIYYDSVVSPIKFVGLFLRVFEMTLPKLVDTISVSSQELKRMCLRLRVEDNRLFKVQVGADLERFNPNIAGDVIKKRYNLNKPVVLYLGQLNGAQYASLFIKAAKIILNEGAKADFMIVGDGLKLGEPKKMASDLFLDDKIIFTGAIEHDQVPEYIAACDVAVACFEDNDITRCKSPLKIVEYLACGKPVVASRVGEVGGMVGDAGILVEPGKAEPLADAIAALISDGNLRARFGANGRRRAESIYNWRTPSTALLMAYRLAIKLRKNGTIDGVGQDE